MLHRWCILLAFVALVAFAGCGGGSVSQDLDSQGNDADRQLSHVTNLFETMLIAGAGQGYPDTGTDVGDLSVWQFHNTLVVEYCLDEGYEYDQDANQNLHLYIGETWPPIGNSGNPTVAPGQFPYSAFADGDCYQFEFNMNQEGWDSADTLYIAAHGVVCEEGDGGGEGGGEEECDGYWVYDICGGDCEPFDAVTIWAGQHIDAGTAYLSIVNDGNDLEVFIDLNDDWELCETQLWLGSTPDGYPQNNNGGPKIGHFPYGEDFGETPPNPTEYTYTVPLTDIEGFFWDGNIADICMALHVTVCRGDDGEGGYAQGETGWAYCPGESYEFPIGWGGTYCFDVCREWIDPDGCGGGGGGEGCETMWAFDLSDPDEENGVSADEDGWFGNFGFNRWGWMFTYIVE